VVELNTETTKAIETPMTLTGWNGIQPNGDLGERRELPFLGYGLVVPQRKLDLVILTSNSGCRLICFLSLKSVTALYTEPYHLRKCYCFDSICRIGLYVARVMYPALPLHAVLNFKLFLTFSTTSDCSKIKYGLVYASSHSNVVEV